MSKPERMSPDYLANVLVRHCVGYCLDAEEAAITLLLAANGVYGADKRNLSRA